MLEKFYPIQSPNQLKDFFNSYIPLVTNQLKLFNINIEDYGIKGDHLGLQTLSKEEFDNIHITLSKYCTVIKQGIIHERRNNTYKLNHFINCKGVELQSIEIFEPKPNADLTKTKAWI